MVSPEHEKCLGIFQLVAHEETQDFYPLIGPVNVVAKEQVVGVRWGATHLKYSKQIRVLAVNIADYIYRTM